LPIFGNFCPFSAIFAHFRRFATILGDYAIFSAKYIGAICTYILLNLAVFRAQNANFSPFFSGENLFKIIMT
jgi:hypothetical protein